MGGNLEQGHFWFLLWLIMQKGTSNNTAFYTHISSQSANRPFFLRGTCPQTPGRCYLSPALERPGELLSLTGWLPSLNGSLRRRGLPAGSAPCVPSEI